MKLKYVYKEAMKQLGIEMLREHQVEPIKAILDEKDTFVIAPTSSGKSAIFQIPALVRHGENTKNWTLVIEPTLSLMRDQVSNLRSCGIEAEYYVSSNREEHEDILEKLTNHKLTFLYTTPEQLQTERFQNAVRDNCPWLMVIDEAHCISEWGTPFFRSAYRSIGNFLEKLKTRPVLAAFTATAPMEYQKQIAKSLGMKKAKFFTMSLVKNNLKVILKDCSDLKIEQLLKTVTKTIEKYSSGGSVVIYCSSRSNVDVLYNHLSKKSAYKEQVTKCHSQMDEKMKESHERLFLDGKRRIMIATSAFAMGVDKPNIRLVLHYNMPMSPVDYYQQIGRAGRDGKNAYAVMLYQEKDIEINKKILQGNMIKKNLGEYLPELSKKKRTQEIRRMMDRFHSLVKILKSSDCIMRQVLEYLGEENPGNCRHCTNCQRKRGKNDD